jgi:hypothetical protein
MAALFKRKGQLFLYRSAGTDGIIEKMIKARGDFRETMERNQLT